MIKVEKSMFIKNPDAEGFDAKSVDLLMREDLHEACMLERCFDTPSKLKHQVTLGNRKY